MLGIGDTKQSNTRTTPSWSSQTRGHTRFSDTEAGREKGCKRGWGRGTGEGERHADGSWAGLRERCRIGERGEGPTAGWILGVLGLPMG